MVLGFSTQFPWGKPTNFPNKILAGEKLHTIRTDANNRWEPGKIIQFATGVRTKNYNQFALGSCTRVFEIIINPEFERVDLVTGQGYKCIFRGAGVLRFAKNDGFDSLEDFWKWFNKPFAGKLIFWELFENGRGQ